MLFLVTRIQRLALFLEVLRPFFELLVGFLVSKTYLKPLFLWQLVQVSLGDTSTGLEPGWSTIDCPFRSSNLSKR